jgi:Uncharacterised nucleotidyltransferase
VDANGTAGGELWRAVARLIDRASLEGILAHRLEPLAAARLRELGRPVPEELVGPERASALGAALAIPLLRRIRAACDGPLVLFKGPELRRLYPPDGRPFGDLDVLAPDPRRVQEALRRAGFRELDGELPPGHHHLRPLVWEDVRVLVEVHPHVNWPAGLERLPTGEILAAAVPSSTGVDGLLAPSPLHHTLILAVHGWQHRPLRVLRDLIDVAATAAEADAPEVERAAEALGAGRLWRTTRGAAGALFYGGPSTPALRTWARSLPRLRARSARGIDLEALVSSFWLMPARQALARDARLVARRLR